MVDNRSAGFYGIGGAFNFKSGDISGTTAKMQDDKMGQGNEYYAQRKDEDDSEKEEKMPFTDRSAQLRATLSSLAMMNVADVIKNRTFQTKLDIEKSHQEKKEEKEKSEKKRKARKREKDLLLKLFSLPLFLMKIHYNYFLLTRELF